MFVSEISFGMQLNILINLKFKFFTCISSFTSVKNELLPSHPLELSEKNVSTTANVAVLTNYEV